MSTPRPPSQPDCTWVEECIEVCTGEVVYVEDRGVRATFLNPRRWEVRKIHYDGCYATAPGRRADFIVGVAPKIDVIVELEGSDTNVKDASLQVIETLEAWRRDQNSANTVAGLIVYGRIEAKKKLPGRIPRTVAVILGLRAEFLKVHKVLLLIHENGERRFTFNDFLR
jgi:hypothetical protein